MSETAQGSSDLTVFARSSFCRIWAEVHGISWKPVDGAPHAGLIYRRSRRLGLCTYELAPRGLYWTTLDSQAPVVDTLIRQVKALRKRTSTLSITINFRHDARGPFDRARKVLPAAACRTAESFTHLLPLAGRDYRQVREASFKATTRRKLRRAERAGLELRALVSEGDLERHAGLYRRWAESKSITPHPAALFSRLVHEMPEAVSLLGAFDRDALVAAILVFRDASEWFYWHGTRDAERDEHSAIYSLMDRAIQDASRAGAPLFNLGASSDIPSLEFFKERWGAERRPVWTLQWSSPLWSRLVVTAGRLAGRGR